MFQRLNTALHIASLGGNTIVAKLLIQYGASVNVQAKVIMFLVFFVTQ